MGATIGAAPPPLRCRPALDGCCVVDRDEESNFTRLDKVASRQSTILVGKSWDMMDGKCVKVMLPEILAESTVRKVQETLPVILPRLEEILQVFHAQIPENRVELLQFFRPPNHRKRELHNIFWGTDSEEDHKGNEVLSAAVEGFVANLNQLGKLDRELKELAIRHCSLDVRPHHYLFIADDMADVMEGVLASSITPETRSAWHMAMLHLARALIEREEVLYKSALHRKGGWQGFREFVIVRRELETSRVSIFGLRPLDAYSVCVDFSPGQFISVKFRTQREDEAVPARSYVIISKPGDQVLRIAVKRNRSGGVATWLHTQGRVGSNVLVSAPFGNFTPSFLEQSIAEGGPSSAVLISAGIGVVQSLALFQAMEARVALVAHVDKSPEVHAFRHAITDLAQTCATKVDAHYTDSSGHPGKEYVAHLLELVGNNHQWYISGPIDFMKGISAWLRSEGSVPVERIHLEVYGPEIGLGWSIDLPS
mmetsp:Transcript_18965/g.44179  ORF Transcript_18965/g.44179 Transcript_18965/m.44179 type:complete len:482 (+) Transcript_18965:33-1478(+)